MRLDHQPRVAVLTLTRDRLAYTQHCFAKLREFAGIDFDLYVLDQGSTDGTWNWLIGEGADSLSDNSFIELHQSLENIGVSRGINLLVGAARKTEHYDWYVKLDNDCELTAPYTLRDSLQDPNWILSPLIQGLDSPPAIEREVLLKTGACPRGHRHAEAAKFCIICGAGPVREEEIRVGETNILGGIFMAVPAWVFDEYRHDESNPIWGMDDVKLVEWFKGRGGRVGYMLDYPANHYLTTAGQREDNIGGYYTRKESEFHGR